MGLLDDLKQEAERVRSEEEEGRSLQAQREAFYRNEIKPALLQVLDFLIELLDQMKVIKPEIHGEFSIPGCPDKVMPAQSIPSLITDSRDSIKTTGVRMLYTLEEFDFTVTPRQTAEHTRDFLTESRQAFSDRAVRATGGQISGLHFVVSRFRVPASIEISADLDNQRIRFLSRNVRGFHQQVDYVSPDVIDQEWLDRLGRYLLGQGESPVGVRLDESNRDALRQMVAEDKARRERELAEADRAQQEDEDTSALSNRVRRLIGSVKGRLPFKGNE